MRIFTDYSCKVCFLFFPTINIVSSTKRLRLNDKSSILWHKRLGHIFRQKMEILPDLDFSVFDTCA